MDNSIWNRALASFRFHILSPLIKKLFFRRLKLLNSFDTLHYIIEHRCSVSRYGDGEFDMVWEGARGFQQYDKRLGKRLVEVLQSELPGHIVCIPYVLKDTSFLRGYAHYFWKEYFEEHYRELGEILNFKKRYYDSMMTRFYMDYEDKTISSELISLLKEIWQGRDVLMVEGCYTVSGIGNDLYVGAHKMRRIICPAENAFIRYDEIMAAIRRQVNSGDLILLSLGMTATVMAYDLAKLGYQAIDLGHLDVEYEWFQMKAEKKTPLNNRYVNEVEGGDVVRRCDDPIYLSQIVEEIL